jgi:gliding motility-associated lipoprotein GldH
MILTKWLTGCILLLCSYCNGNALYTQKKRFLDHAWPRQDTCAFTFAIQDATQPYDIYLWVEYTPDYPYQNLHIQYQLQDNQANSIAKVLQDNLLFDPKTGKPLGKGWGKKKCLRLPLVTHYQFREPGEYSLSLIQFMRTEKLLGVDSIGIQLYRSSTKTH